MNSGLSVKTPQSDLWETPPEVFEPLDREFNFSIDVAATERTATCSQFFTKEDDGLIQPWSGQVVWCNPPYSNGQLKDWTGKAWTEIYCPNPAEVIVMLLPAFVDQGWFHDYVNGKAELRFFRGRIRFLFNGERQGQPRFASMLAIWRGR